MPEADAGFARYQADPVGFGREVLGETFTPDVVRVMESVRDNPVTVARSANGVGKTHGAARIAVWFYKVFPGSQVYTAAAPPEDNLKRLLWGEIGDVVGKHVDLFDGDSVSASLNIARNTREFITGVAIPMAGTVEQREAKFSGKHAPYLLFIVDEGDAVPEEVYRGIESCMSGGHARLLIMFNPRISNGIVYRMEKERRANVVELTAFNHPNVIDGRDVYPGAVSREVTVRRINKWSRALSAIEKHDAECFEVPECLIGCVAKAESGEWYAPLAAGWRKVSNPALAYMVLGRYPAQSEAALISQSWIDAARARYDLYVAEFGEVPPASVQPVSGLDVADTGVDKNVQCFRYGGWLAPIEKWTGIDMLKTGRRAALNSKERGARTTQVDGTGVGAGVAPTMAEEGAPAVSVKVGESPTESIEEGEFAQLRDQLWWLCREWLRSDSSAMLPPDDDLCEELAVPTYGFDRKGRIKIMDKDTMRELLKRSPDSADSLCLTFAEGEPAYSEAVYEQPYTIGSSDF